MVKSIIWKQAAERTFESITNHLHDEYSLQAAHNFAKLVYDKIDRLSKYPLSGPKVAGRITLRYVNFGKHYQMFYRVVGTTLVISNFFDTRRNPNSRPF